MNGSRHSHFSSHREEVWRQLADQFQGDFTTKGTWQSEKVTARADGWTVILDIRSISRHKSVKHLTRLRAPFVNEGELRFAIYRKTFVHKVGTLLGMQDIEVEYPLLDREFVIQSNQPERIRRLLDDAKIRELLEKEPDLYLHVRRAEEATPGPSSQTTDELHLEIPELIEDAKRLEEVYELFAEVLRTLSDLGVA